MTLHLNVYRVVYLEVLIIYYFAISQNDSLAIFAGIIQK